jgi:uncharacterized protein YhbP (UPF0306 family)
MDRNRRKLQRVAAFLDTETTLALATVTVGGSARVTPLFYLPQGLRLYWFSSSSSGHSRNLGEHPPCAVTVYSRTDDWKQIRGVQMRGMASMVHDPPLCQAITAAYTARFRLGKLFAANLSKSGLYCFDPEWLRYIDNSRRFGYKFELFLHTAP